MFKKLLLAIALLVAVTSQAVFAADVMKMVPEAADFVVRINVSKILAMPEVKKALEESMNKDADQKKTYEELKAKSGFDIMKDLQTIAVFTTSKMTDKTQTAGAVIEGNFDVEKMCQIIKEDEGAQKDVEVTKIDGFNAIVPKNKKEGYAMFLDNQFLAVGTQEGVDSVKNVKTGKAKSVESKTEFFSIIQKLNTSSSVCGALNFTPEFKAQMANNPQAEAFACLNNLCFDFNNDKNLVLNLKAEADKEENVEKVNTSLNGLVSMLKMFASQTPEFCDVINLIKITKEGKAVMLNLDVPAEKIAAIKAKLEEQAKQQKANGGVDVNAPRENTTPAADDAK